MHEMNMADLANWLKLSPKYLLPLAVLSTCLLFLPPSVLAEFGVDTFAQTYHIWIGPACLALWCILLSHAGFALAGTLTKRRQRRDTLRRLSPSEKAILSKFILRRTKTVPLDVTRGVQQGVATGLVNDHIVYEAGTVPDYPSMHVYNMEPWAWDELNAHTELLEPELSVLRSETSSGSA
jgi:hypothetical protein